ALYETNGAAGALEEPQIAVARHIDEPLDGSAAAPVVDKDRWRYLIPIPGVIGVILEMTFDLTGGHIKCDGGCGIKIVPGTLIAYPWAAVAGTKISDIGVHIVVPGDPDRGAPR